MDLLRFNNKPPLCQITLQTPLMRACLILTPKNLSFSLFVAPMRQPERSVLHLRLGGAVCVVAQCVGVLCLCVMLNDALGFKLRLMTMAFVAE